MGDGTRRRNVNLVGWWGWCAGTYVAVVELMMGMTEDLSCCEKLESLLRVVDWCF